AELGSPNNSTNVSTNRSVVGLQALVVTNAATSRTYLWGGKLWLPQRPKVFFSLWQLRCLCQAGAWQPKQQHKRQHKRICDGIASSGCYKCGYKPHPPLGWQALLATKAEGLFPLAASLPLPSRSLAAQTTA
ncbi:MAG: hypothetical protein M0Q19_08955, partial [Candidatus Cloacimonetes bacterium]|nr:hypothetical protein [Candidatus Cloacimonadota bacterium]